MPIQPRSFGEVGVVGRLGEIPRFAALPNIANAGQSEIGGSELNP